MNMKVHLDDGLVPGTEEGKPRKKHGKVARSAERMRESISTEDNASECDGLHRALGNRHKRLSQLRGETGSITRTLLQYGIVREKGHKGEPNGKQTLHLRLSQSAPNSKVLRGGTGDIPQKLISDAEADALTILERYEETYSVYMEELKRLNILELDS